MVMKEDSLASKQFVVLAEKKKTLLKDLGWHVQHLQIIACEEILPLAHFVDHNI
jgi:hypothetical protein